MSNPNIEFYLLLLSLLLCSAISLRLFLLKTKNRKTTQNLHTVKSSLINLQEQLTKLEDDTSDTKVFDHDLTSAALTTNLQKSRTQYHKRSTSSLPPERYRYIRSLIENGLDSSTIASILAISHQEAEQLVALSKLSLQRELSLSDN